MKLKLSAFSSHYNPFTHRLGLTETDQTSPIYISRTFVDLARVAVSACVVRAGQARNEINIVLNYTSNAFYFEHVLSAYHLHAIIALNLLKFSSAKGQS